MANVNLTLIGYNNLFRVLSDNPVRGPGYLFDSGLYREKDYMKYYDFSKSPAIFHDTKPSLDKEYDYIYSLRVLNHQKLRNAVCIDGRGIAPTEISDSYRGYYDFRTDPCFKWAQNDKFYGKKNCFLASSWKSAQKNDEYDYGRNNGMKVLKADHYCMYGSRSCAK